jgi:hypothetical protein
LALAWSRWRRRHQAGARRAHYQRRERQGRLEHLTVISRGMQCAANPNIHLVSTEIAYRSGMQGVSAIARRVLEITR